MSNFLRIGGLASGMDIDSLVSDMMKVQRMKRERIEQDRTVMEWKRSDYRTMNNEFRKLRDETFSMRLQGTFLTKTATSSDPSKVTATAAGAGNDGVYNIKVTSLATATTTHSSTAITGDPDAALNDGEFKFEINGKEFTVGNDDSLNSVIRRVNSDPDVGVTMFFDPDAKSVVITNRETGAQEITLRDTQAGLSSVGFIEGVFKLDMSSADADGIAHVTGGQDAQVEINGLSTTKSSNTFNLNGITFDLKEPTGGSTVRVEVKRDTDAIFDKIKGWIETYNNTLDAVNKELSEERYRGYKPLTQDQMEQLTDKQMDQWEEKAKSGLLKHDPVLRGELSSIRMAAFGSVDTLDPEFNHLSEIGISVSDASYGSNGKLSISDDYLSGKLYIDEAELREAIEQNPDKVMALFTNSSDVASEKGIAVRVYESVGDAIDTIADIAGRDSELVDDSFLGKSIRDLNKQILKEDDNLKRLEDRYWRQFTAMEEAINKMNQQSNWLASQLGMG